MRAPERSHEVGGQDDVPELLGHRVEVLEGDGVDGVRGAGVVDEDIQPPEVRCRLLDHALRDSGLRDVAGSRDYVQTRAAQPLDLLRPAAVVGKMVEGHLRPAPPEQLHRGEPDARLRTAPQHRAQADAALQRAAPPEGVERGLHVALDGRARVFQHAGGLPKRGFVDVAQHQAAAFGGQ